MRSYIKVSYTPKKTPLDLHAERFIRDYPRGLYKPITITPKKKLTASKERNIVKQVRTPRRVIKRGANVK